MLCCFSEFEVIEGTLQEDLGSGLGSREVPANGSYVSMLFVTLCNSINMYSLYFSGKQLKG
jgi:hypothetical protein